ncbi:MAG TPA: RNA 2'-phosphotransferase [Flavobacteriales bacterium]|nr:RNA 2'-phosphotransferase [Flavobacteriales bacterium]
MNKADHTRLSKFLSLVLRHDPGSIGIELNAEGWTPISELIERSAAHGHRFDVETLRTIVKESDKQRFALSDDGTLIRANQGHSVRVELGYAPIKPPAQLFHGTAKRYVEAILEQGLIKGTRHHVHLSSEKETALKVGRRHGEPFIFIVHSGLMHDEGLDFFCSENGVWLTDHVPPRFLSLTT